MMADGWLADCPTKAALAWPYLPSYVFIVNARCQAVIVLLTARSKSKRGSLLAGLDLASDE